MDINCKTTMSDDEEDLELLRMAALQTLKKPTANPPPNNAQHQKPAPVNKFNSPPHLKRGRGFHLGPGRGGRNGQFNGRARNSNLISITTIQTEDETVKYAESSPAPKLILPQDRYCNAKQEQDDKPKEKSKFNRYDKSDDSESEDESEPEASDSESTVKLERSNSLEALMQELEYEISGEKPLKAKGKIKRRKRQDEVEEEEVKPEIVEVTQDVQKEIPEVKEAEVEVELKVPRKKRSRSPNYRKRSPLNGTRRFNFSKNFIPNYVEPPPQIPLNFNLPYTNMSYIPPPLYQPQLPPPAYVHRPLSPLNLNTEVLSTITMAPLSPRSAAFVLQNREIIERRKKSPRRSYSRSPSPRFRRSLSPRRTPSPRRYPRSASPSRKRKSPRRVSPKRLPPPKSIQDRLGKKEAVKKETTPPPIEEEKLDPILEARRKKFNEQEVVAKEKIIRLKPKVEEPKDEEVEPDLLDLDADLKDIFSDEESDNENEGRFKSSTSTTRNVSVLPFTKLVNGTDIKNKPLEETCRNLNNVNRRERERRPRREERRKRTASPLSSSAKQPKKTERASARLNLKADRKEAVTSPIETKKIEIKIRNPSKYDADTKDEKPASRKVAVSDVKENTIVQEIQDPEVIIDEEEDDDVIRKTEAGDLRAQLSRKRAERQHKVPLAAEDVQSRLLHNALQGAVFKKAKKSKRKEKETGPKDKLPIHLRLGVPNDTELKRKKKNKGRTTEQV